MFAVGIAGYIGLRRNRSHLLILHLIAAGLGMVLVIQELSKVCLIRPPPPPPLPQWVIDDLSPLRYLRQTFTDV